MREQRTGPRVFREKETVKRTHTLPTAVTQWVENPTGGRARGPTALVRAWVEILRRPRQFFRAGVAPGDQAPGLVFAVTVILFEEVSRYAVVQLAGRGLLSTGPFDYPAIGGFSPGVAVLALFAILVFVTPATVHLTAALQTLLLLPVASDRGGVSETVQVLCYAMAPCLLAGLPSAEVRVLVTAWGAGLYLLGTAVIHNIRFPVAAVVGAVPAVVVFGYGFRGFQALSVLIADYGF